MFKFADNGPEYDFPLFEGIPRVYAIAAIPRSGSTLLSKALWATGRAGAPRNYFEPRSIADLRKRWGNLTLREIRDLLIRHRTSPNGWFGYKVHWHELVRYFGANGEPDLGSLLRPQRLIYTYRVDRIGQAVSYARASQTQRYTSDMPALRTPVYRRSSIVNALGAIIREEMAWKRHFGSRHDEVLSIEYEQLVANYTETVRRAATYIGIDLQIEDVTPPPIDRVSDAINREWRERFLTEAHGIGVR